MPAKILTQRPAMSDQKVDKALELLGPLPDNVMVVVTHLQDQITALTTRVEELESA
jgi:hypothetical protein